MIKKFIHIKVFPSWGDWLAPHITPHSLPLISLKNLNSGIFVHFLVNLPKIFSPPIDPTWENLHV